jgi:hypothetical protein
MKRLIKLKNALGLALPLLVVLSSASCKKETNQGGKGVPTISRVRTVSKIDTISKEHKITLDSSSTYGTPVTIAFDSTTTTGKLNNQYAIMGTNLATTSKVLLNGTDVYYNPALVTDQAIIFTVPTTTPWAGTQPNTLTVVTKYGKVDFAFNIQQPPATIASFAPLAASAGDIVTLTGVNFDGATAVKFNDTPAEIVSKTATEIKVKVPAGVVQAYIYVTTPGGTAKSRAAFGFKYVIYDDVLANGWWVGGWGGANDAKFASTAVVKRGTHSVAITYTGGYGGFQIGNGGADISLTNFTAIKLSIYGGPGVVKGNKVRIAIMGPDAKGTAVADDKGVVVELKPNEWTDFNIPISSFGTGPVKIQEFRIQEFSGAVPETIYVDDIGFI